MAAPRKPSARRARPQRTPARAALPKKAATPAPRARTQPRSPNGAAALVAQLEASGVDTAFGIPGVHNLAIFDALRRSKIRTILVRHEATAVYAADGYARATGRLAVAVTTTGPGAANTAGAMGEARASRSPLIHVSTQIDEALLGGHGGRWSLHENPHQLKLMGAVSTWSASVARAEAIPTLIARAAIEAFAGRRGPVFVEIPTNELSEPVTWDPRAVPAVVRAGADDRQIARAVETLRDAKRPVVWAGGGAIASGASEEVAALAELLDAPVVTTFGGKGILPRDHALLVGYPPHQPEVAKLLASSDAIVVVGSDLDGMNTQNWRLPLPRPRVSINTVAEDARRNYASDVVVESDAAVALRALIPLLTPRRSRTAARRVADVRAKADASVRAKAEFRAPYAFVRALEDVVPEACNVVCDMAIAGYWAGAYFRPARPRAFQYPLGWGTLGFALPASIGSSASGARTLAICGDAGALYAIGELATAAQEELPLTILVVNDGGYGMLRFDERERFGEEFASDLRTPDFVALAKSFGVPGKRATEDGAPAAIKWALGRSGPALVQLDARWAPPLTTSPRWPLKGKPEARP